MTKTYACVRFMRFNSRALSEKSIPTLVRIAELHSSRTEHDETLQRFWDGFRLRPRPSWQRTYLLEIPASYPKQRLSGIDLWRGRPSEKTAKISKRTRAHDVQRRYLL